MRYRLGLDLGVSSIGSAVIQLSDENEAVKIIDAGCRIFEVSEGAEDRRLKRTARKNTIRTKKRLELLADLLFKNGLWTSSDPAGTRKIRALSPYELRAKALDEKLSAPEMIGRIVLHLAKHRGAGFVSAAAEMEEEILEAGEKKKNSSPYEKMAQHLKDTHSRTLGEYFYKRICESYEKHDPSLRMVRQRNYALSCKAVDYAIPRYLVKDEFNLIWDSQARFYPVMNKDGLKDRVYSILFFEHPAFPYAIGKCVYFNDEDRLLKAHPLSEQRRIYESVNNIRILTAKDKRRLTLEERDLIVAELMKGHNAGKKVIKGLLHLPADQKISIDDDKGAPIKAYLYATDTFTNIPYFSSISEEQLCDFINFLADPRNPDDKNGRLYNEDGLISVLKTKLGVVDEKQIGELLVKLPKGRSMLGATATKAILAGLKAAVLSQREITDELAKTDSHFMAEEEIARQNQGKFERLPYYGKILTTDTAPLPEAQIKNNPTLNEDEKKYGKIANPAVHMILNQLCAVVNDIIRIYGRPYEISLEVGRDVGLSTKKIKELENRNKENNKLNDEAKKELQNSKIPATAKNILKYKLAKQQGWKDAYNPIKNISLKDLSGCEIEHIIPQAKHGTDTFNNLVLVSATDNRQKSDEYAYDFFQRTKSDAEIRAILEFARDKLKEKAWRFEPDARERFEETGDEDETTRYMTDTRYVSKMAQRYLRAIIDCPQTENASEVRILAPRGGYTAQLRTAWNLDGIEYELSGIDVPRYLPCAPHYVNQETGEIVEGSERPDIDGAWRYYDRKKNPQWMKKPRLDHRHHAMDAIVVACLSRSFMQKMAWREKRDDYQRMRADEYPLPLSGMDAENRKKELAIFRQNVISVLKRVLVSHKPDHSKAGQLHKDTGRTVLDVNPVDKNSTVIVYKRKIRDILKKKEDLKKLLVSSAVKDEWATAFLEKEKPENMTEREWKRKKKLWTELPKDREKQVELFSLFEDYYPSCLQTLKEKKELEDKNKREVSEGMVLNEVLKTLQRDKLWNGDIVKCYESSSALIDIPKHGVAYESGNNWCIDFYEQDGKIGWEVTSNFDANQPDYMPEWKRQGAKQVWRLQKSDMIELDTPEEWKHYTDQPRCLARVKKFSEGALSIDYLADARMTSPIDKTLKYMIVETLVNRGLSYLLNHHARKIELTPFGKIKRRHKMLKDGKKKKA